MEKEIVDFAGTVTFEEAIFGKDVLSDYPHMDGYPVTAPNIDAFKEAGYILTLNGIEFSNVEQFLKIYYRNERIENAKNTAKNLKKLQNYTKFENAFPE